MGQSCHRGYRIQHPQQGMEGEGSRPWFLRSSTSVYSHVKYAPLISSFSCDECRTWPMVPPFPFSNSLCWIFPQIISPGNPFSEALQTDTGILITNKQTNPQHKNPPVKYFLGVAWYYRILCTKSQPGVELAVICVKWLENRTSFKSKFPFEGWTSSVSKVRFLVQTPDSQTDIY